MNTGYIKSLDGVRAIAIILVMTFHANITHFGWLGVQLFFVLSGFLITGILWKEKFSENPLSFKFKKFWVRRSLRIFPLYFGYLLVLTGTYLLFHFPSYYKTYALNLFTYTFNYTRTLPQWHANPLFTHLWSLSIEEQFYLFFPWIIFLLPKKVIKILMIGVIISAPLIRLLLANYYSNKGYEPSVVADIVYWNTFSHLDAFFMGGLIPVLRFDKTIRKPQRIFITSLIIVIVAGIVNYATGNSVHSFLTDFGYSFGSIENYQHIWHYTVLNTLFASFILTITSEQSKDVFKGLRKLLENRWMVRIGKVSYGMYIYHWLILIYVFQHHINLGSYQMKVIVFLPYLVTVYLAAEVSYNLYESYFIKLKDKFFVHKKEGIQDIKPAVLPVASGTVPYINETSDEKFTN